MCKNNNPRRIDPCIKNLIKELRRLGINTRGSCCSHFRYNLTIVVERKNKTRYDLVSGIEIPRRRKSYKLDSKGFYYIPEVQYGRR